MTLSAEQETAAIATVLEMTKASSSLEVYKGIKRDLLTLARIRGIANDEVTGIQCIVQLGDSK